MRLTAILLVAAAFASLFQVGSAQAAPPARPIGFRPQVQMRPGQDWWRIYPWSAYNAWRNIYWYPPYNRSYPYPPYQVYPYPLPPVYPYPLPQPYPVPLPYPGVGTVLGN